MGPIIHFILFVCIKNSYYYDFVVPDKIKFHRCKITYQYIFDKQKNPYLVQVVYNNFQTV